MTAHDVLTTVGYDGFVRSLFNRSGDPSKDFAHAVLGIVTEVYEIRSAKDSVNRLEEAGDLTFYSHALMQVVCDSLGITTEEWAKKDADPFLAEMGAIHFGSLRDNVDRLSNELLDIAKRWVGYGRAPTDMVRAAYIGVYVVACAIEDSGLKGGVEEAARVNVEKLLERYKGMTFSAEHAVNRDLAAERSVLEHAAAA